MGVLVTMGVLTAAGSGLVVVGANLVRDSTAGRYVEPTAGPDEPGYQAYVVPTPTLGVVQEGTDGRLAGLALLALGADDTGGTVVLVPPSTLVPFGDDEITIADAYDDSGAAAAITVLEGILRVDVAETVEVDGDRWAELVEPVAPIPVAVEDTSSETDTVRIDADEVAAFVGPEGIDPGDDGSGGTELDRLDREAAFWRGWLDAVADAGDGAVPGEVEVGIGRFVRGLAAGEATVVALPVDTDVRDDAMYFHPDGDQVAVLMTDAVPYPVSPAPGVRPRVRLLNGTRDRALASEVADVLVGAGAEITIAGNGPSFDETGTRFIPRLARDAPAATELADALGVGQVEPARLAEGTGEQGDDEIDVTVILGADAEDVIEGVADN